ncbi:ATP-binding protein [Brevundimonas sp.]|uniref:ATP-binding protein n=1 Tax=Brevundimonas sp. TaxID=1871086 RepID=UPI001A18A85C|nr:ATP-binding protein [Brevundimonas sp.]MBJ7483500.1 ATP-binding protein [Brevundimonas sp.]
MTALAKQVSVERRFALSARLDSDLNGTPPLSGYVMQESVRKALQTMTLALTETDRRAFTWTGPYGGGKSCAALLVANLVAGSKAQKALAEEIVGVDTAAEFKQAFPTGRAPWKAIALTGRRAPLLNDLVDSARAALGWSDEQAARALADDRALIKMLEAEAVERSGLLIVLDELGKSFEHAAATGGDIHLLQDLAERAGRSQGRIVIIGILHQSFDQYADRVNRSARKEWAKVQGRYQNIPFVAHTDEVAALIAHAIDAKSAPADAHTLANAVAHAVAARRPVDTASLSETLARAWPLHPITTLILGPVSRQRFAQNERSVFGFLSSAEPFGFKSHLENTQDDDADVWFGPDRLWDYLVANLGSALSVGPDGSRMSLALEAVERASLRGALHARLVKSAALIEFFRNGSGLAVSDDFLALSVPEFSPNDVEAALRDLTERAILIRQPRLGGYALFAGSDFDLEEALGLQTEVLNAASLVELPARVAVGPYAAKRHYFETGALRTFDVVVQFGEDTGEKASDWAQSAAQRLAKRPRKSAGLLVILVPDGEKFEIKPEKAALELSRALEAEGVVAAVAAAKSVIMLRDVATELFALDRIEQNHPALEGDRIARREVAARRAQLIDAVRTELLATFGKAQWWSLGMKTPELDGSPLSVIASAVAGEAYCDAPIIHSELLCRDKPSTSAMAGLRALAHAMVNHAPDKDLGMTGFPAEMGLYLTILRPLGLHRPDNAGVWRFQDPAESREGKSLENAWRQLAKTERYTLEDIYKTWGARPYGIKRGVMPVIALAFILANRSNLAVYLDDLYQASIDEIFVDKMMQSPTSIGLRMITRAKKDEALIHHLALLLSRENAPVDADALPVASALFQRFRALPQWAQRTATLSPRARKVRDIVLKANDPEALLFTDLADALSEVTDPAVTISHALAEAEAAYPAMLADLTRDLANHLSVDPATFAGLGPRALTAAGVTADLRLDAFATRAGAFDGGTGDIEGLASLLVHRPARSWSDREHEQALFEMARLAVRFKEAEAFAGLKGRAPTSRAISVMVGVNPEDKPLVQSFAVTDAELDQADQLAKEFIERILSHAGPSTIGMAALARAVERLSLSEPEETA